MVTTSVPVVRPYRRTSDARATHEVFRSAILESAARDYGPEQLEAWAGATDTDLAGWDDRRAAADTVVAVVDERVVGFADLQPDGLVDMLFVHPEFSRRGIARMLIGVVERTARETGIATLRTYASRTARPAFEQFGFQVVADRPDNIVGGMIVPNYEMRCDLGSGGEGGLP